MNEKNTERVQVEQLKSVLGTPPAAATAASRQRGQAWFAPANRRRVLDALEQVRPVAEAHGATLAQLAVAWVVAQAGVATALVGARNAAQAAEKAAAGDLQLADEELATVRATFEALEAPQRA